MDQAAPQKKVIFKKCPDSLISYAPYNFHTKNLIIRGMSFKKSQNLCYVINGQSPEPNQNMSQKRILLISMGHSIRLSFK